MANQGICPEHNLKGKPAAVESTHDSSHFLTWEATGAPVTWELAMVAGAVLPAATQREHVLRLLPESGSDYCT